MNDTLHSAGPADEVALRRLRTAVTRAQLDPQPSLLPLPFPVRMALNDGPVRWLYRAAAGLSAAADWLDGRTNA